MKKSKVLLSLTGTVLALSMLAVPASAHGGHHGGGHHGGRAAAVYCTVCDGNHDRGDCPNYCGDCGYSHTGDCADYCGDCGYTHAGDCAGYTGAGHHKGHGQC